MAALNTTAPSSRPGSAVVPPPSAYPRRVVGPRAPGIFDNSNLQLPGYEDISDHLQRFIYAAATTKIHGDPWAPAGDALETLVSDVLKEIENELALVRDLNVQRVREWFQIQRAALILIGVKVGRAAHALWEPEYAVGIFIELGMRATERAISDLARENPKEQKAIQDWNRAYEPLVHVLGISVTAALGLGGVLARLTDDEVDDEGKAGHDDEVSEESDEAEAGENDDGDPGAGDDVDQVDVGDADPGDRAEDDEADADTDDNEGVSAGDEDGEGDEDQSEVEDESADEDESEDPEEDEDAVDNEDEDEGDTEDEDSDEDERHAEDDALDDEDEEYDNESDAGDGEDEQDEDADGDEDTDQEEDEDTDEDDGAEEDEDTDPPPV